MKVFFNHAAKCAGSSINHFAQIDYCDNFHTLTQQTSPSELSNWLNKKRVFISSELFHISAGNLGLLLNTPGLAKLFIARNPVERYKSFCSHSTRDKGLNSTKSTSFWGHEKYINQEITCDDWIMTSLEKFEKLLVFGNTSKLLPIDTGLIFPIYSQWWLATFKSIPNIEYNRLDFVGPNYFKHISKIRDISFKSGIPLEELIFSCMHSIYTLTGTTDKLDHFLEDLFRLGIFKTHYLNSIPRNESNHIRIESPEIYEVPGKTALKYLSLIPEEFYVYNACQSKTHQMSQSPNLVI